MLLPSEYDATRRVRYNAYLQNLETVYGRDQLDGHTGWDYEVTNPYVAGEAHITVDSSATLWRYSRRQIAAGRTDLKSVDFGGPFISNQIVYTPPNAANWTQLLPGGGGWPTLLLRQKGPTWPCFNTYNKFLNPISTREMPIGTGWDELWALGGSYVAQTMPTVPVMNLSVAVGEVLLDGLPKKMGSSIRKKMSLKSGADEYLNYIFGWTPLLSDVKTLLLALPAMEDAMMQIVRDNGNIVRRKTKPRTADVDASWDHVVFPFGGITPGSNTSGLCKHTVTKRVTTWFSAAYIYNLPSSTEVKNRFTQMRYILGMDADAVTIWNLLPWSWLVDWVLPVSPVLQNLSVMARNQVRINRAYIMCHTRYSESVLNGSFAASLTMESKQRDHASPWGFGAKTPDLTTQQLAILASLGLSRGHVIH